VTALSSEAEAQLVDRLECELLGGTQTPAGGDEIPDPVMDDLLSAIDEAIRDDLEMGISHALELALRRSGGSGT
jgi:hypothetical protein